MKVGRDGRKNRRTGVRRELFAFYGAVALALLVVSIGAVVASRSVAESQALADAEAMTTRLADLVIAPLLGDAMSGGAEEKDDLVRAVDNRMKDGYLRQMTVWDADGRIVFANDPAVIGTQADPPPEVGAAITNGTVSSDFESHPEASTLTPDQIGDGLVEVYVPLHIPGHEPMAFEAYYDSARVNVNADNLMTQLIPLVLIPLAVLMIIQIPIAVSMSRRIRRHDEERAAMLEHSLSVSEKERIRVAADLHDGPIQELAGIGYALGAVSAAVPEAQQPLMRTAQETVLSAIESLRRLMVDLYPPDLSVSQLPTALSDLAEPLRRRGIDIEFTVDPLPAMNIDMVTTIYRIAHEALANVVEHANASRVRINLEADREEAATTGSWIHLAIIDNGVGVDPAKLDKRSDGHLGLRLLQSRVEDLGGTLTVALAPDGGTAVEAIIPVDTDEMNTPRPARSSKVWSVRA